MMAQVYVIEKNKRNKIQENVLALRKRAKIKRLKTHAWNLEFFVEPVFRKKKKNGKNLSPIWNFFNAEDEVE